MFRTLRRIRWELGYEGGRFHIMNAIWRLVPGRAGQDLRARKIVPLFAEAGEDIVIQEGVRFVGITKLRVGSRVNIAPDCFLQASGGLTLEDEVMLGPSVKIWTINHKTEDINVPIMDQGYLREEVVIGKGCWLGANVFVMPGVRLAEGCVVAAGSVLSKKKYPAYSIIAGYPARKIGTRKPEDSEKSGSL